MKNIPVKPVIIIAVLVMMVGGYTLSLKSEKQSVTIEGPQGSTPSLSEGVDPNPDSDLRVAMMDKLPPGVGVPTGPFRNVFFVTYDLSDSQEAYVAYLEGPHLKISCRWNDEVSTCNFRLSWRNTEDRYFELPGGVFELELDGYQTIWLKVGGPDELITMNLLEDNSRDQ